MIITQARCHQYTSVLSAEELPNMPWKESEAVPESNGPVPQKVEFGSGEHTLADLFRLFGKTLDRRMEKLEDNSNRWDKKLDEILED